VSEKFFKARAGQIRLIQLERQLIEANERIKRLEEAGDAMAKDFSHFWTDRNSVRDWPKAKEAKP
jgi:hypothetical protein